MTGDRNSVTGLWAEIPRAYKLVVAVLGTIGALWAAGWTAGQVTASVYAEAATKTYVREQVSKAVTAAATTCDRKTQPDSAPCRVENIERARAAETLAAEQTARDRRTVERAMMKRLVSYDATDRETNRRLKMSAASSARNAFADRCAQYVTTGSCAGMSLEEAAQFALDARSTPP